MAKKAAKKKAMSVVDGNWMKKQVKDSFNHCSSRTIIAYTIHKGAEIRGRNCPIPDILTEIDKQISATGRTLMSGDEIF